MPELLLLLLLNGHICVYESMNTTQEKSTQHLSTTVAEVTSNTTKETSWNLSTIYGSVSGTVLVSFLLCVCLFLACRTKKSKASVILSRHNDQPTQDLDSEPDYVNQMEEHVCHYSVDLQAKNEDSTSENDYVNTKTMTACEAYQSDSNSEPDYENSAYLKRQNN